MLNLKLYKSGQSNFNIYIYIYIYKIMVILANMIIVVQKITLINI